MLTDLMLRLRALVRRRSVERELDEEIRLHLEHEIERYRQAGMPQPEAARRAHLALGGLEQIKEQCRDARGVRLIDTTQQDLRYAFRAIRRNPGVAAVAIVSLALGIGANTAMFTLIHAVMLRSLPVTAPDGLVAVGDPSRPTAFYEGAPMIDVLSRDNLVLLKVDPAASGYTAKTRWSRARARELIERLQSLPGVRGVTMSNNGLFSGGDSHADSLQIEGFQSLRAEDRSASFDLIGPAYFQTLGVALLAGREFDGRDTAEAPRGVVVNETMAEAYFGTRHPLGKSIQNGGDHYTIIGVVKDSKQHALKEKTERRFYISILQDPDPLGSLHFLLRTRVDATSAISAVRHELQMFDSNLRVEVLQPVRALIDQAISSDRRVAHLFSLFGVLAVFLPVAGLYGVTSYAISRRTGEIGLRMALGATRGAVVRMVLRDLLTLVAVGLAIGLPAALVVSRLTAATLANVSPTDPLITATAPFVMLFAGLCAGVIPAVRASHVDPVAALRRD